MLALLLSCTGDPVGDTAVPFGLPDEFHVGVNYPWRSYGSDFGSNAWSVGGAVDHSEAISADFAALAGAGVSVVRWFVLTDGRSGIVFDADGSPESLDPQVLDDFDAAVSLAEQHGLVLVPSLIDFWWLAPPEVIDGVQMGGHAGVIARPDSRAALIDGIFRPLLARHGQSPAVGAWEVINEPEWGIEVVGGGWLGDSVSLEAMVAFVDESAAAIHQETAHPATLGSASIDATRLLWTQRDLDLIQVHSYDGAAQRTDAATISAAPVVVGELGTSGAYGSLGANLSTLEANGYAGVWLWSMHADDEASALDLDEIAAWSASR